MADFAFAKSEFPSSLAVLSSQSLQERYPPVSWQIARSPICSSMYIFRLLLFL
jgi:hypothetical protein